MFVTRIVGALITVVLTFGISGVASAATTFPGANGLIAYTKNGPGQENVWQVNAAGAQQRPLTYGGGNNPVWSPDGNSLLFTNPLTHRLQIMRSDGLGLRNLSKQQGYAKERSAAWSSDGTHIAFIREQTVGTSKRQTILVSNRQGTQEIVAAQSQSLRYQSLSWSPDGTQIVYEQASAAAASLQIINLQTHSTHQLVELSDVTPSAHVSWSPNGKKILFNDSANEVYTIWTDGSHRSVISDGDSYDASWSPDGTKAVFLEAYSGEGVSIREQDGTVIQLPIAQGAYEQLAAPIWSPDGTKLLFTMTDTSGNAPVSDLFLYDIASGTTAKVAQNIIGAYSWQAL